MLKVFLRLKKALKYGHFQSQYAYELYTYKKRCNNKLELYKIYCLQEKHLHSTHNQLVVYPLLVR